MNARAYAGLFLLGMTVVGTAAVFQAVPGYMDADYYYVTGQQLAQGRGFWEPFLWNYLDDPAGLPHSGNTYWMPLATILVATGMWLSGNASFSGARLGFLLAAALLPPMAAALSARLSGKRGLALLTGCLAAFPGFYLVYLPTTDTFGLYAVLGGFWLLAAWSSQTSGRAAGFWQPGVLGLLSGFMHLARADGGLWLGLGFLWWALVRPRQAAGFENRFPLVGRRDWAFLGVLLSGY
ncbi:MAG TPA: hypothetical protein VJ436_12785, partial [Anaerolineales bacterium]|nr:hypothetical protein [Anaerolineales bacterium]